MRQMINTWKRHKIAVMEYQRITLRIPADLHQELMDVAEDKSMSMNAVVIARLRLAGGLPIEDGQLLTDAQLEQVRELIQEELDKRGMVAPVRELPG